MKGTVARGTTRLAEVTAIRPVAASARELPASQTHYAERDGLKFAGTHLIIDMWGASNLDDLTAVDRAMRDAVQAVGATLLRLDLHHFEPGGGISGVALLAESHISIHSWPETGYVALDIFVCGDCEAHRCLPVFKAAFQPQRLTVAEHRRGIAL